MMQLSFARPEWVWIGALACAALAGLMVRAGRKRRDAIRRFAAASPDTSVGRHRRWLRHALAMTGVAMACLALARPLAGYHLEQDLHQGLDLMFAVDTSKSMRAADLRPDRLTRAKLAVADLVQKFAGERIGLIAFAGDAFVQAPMTVDRGVLLASLDALDTDTIPRGGTDIASAIRAAEQALASEPDHHKVLVLLSDGEDLAGDAIDAARDAARHGLTIFTVGVGSRRGELISVAGQDGASELVRDASGQPVRSRLDEATLRGIAQVTGGAYQPLGADGRGLDTLYAVSLARLPRSTGPGTAHKVYSERFQIPLAIALGCLLLELVIVDRRRSALVARGAGIAAALLILFVPRPASADPTDRAAVSSYNAGTSAYHGGEFAAAQRQFEAALLTPDVGLQSSAYYDLGNARYRAGQATLSKDRDATIAAWKQSIAAYDGALALGPSDADAKFNRDFVARKLAELERQQDQQRQPTQAQNQQKSQGQQKQDQKSGQGQSQQDQKSGQGQPSKQDQKSGQGQSQQDQKSGQGQSQQDQKSGQGQSQQDQKSGQGQPSKQQATGGLDRDKPTRDGQPRDARPKPQTPQAPDAADGADRAAAAEARADAQRRKAGELTRGEAVQLLDSVDGDLKPMPIHGREAAPADQPPIKDW